MSIQNQIINKYVEETKLRHDAHKDYVKNLITIGVGFLALFVGLKSDNIICLYAKHFFLITIVLLVFGILFSSVALYFEIYIHDKNQEFLKACMADHLDGKLSSNRLNVTPKPWYYKMFEKLGFTFFLLSPISLIVYVYFLEIKCI